MSEKSSVRARTRLALLRAGIETLAVDPSAPLAEIAARAGVSRSTLHRYFPDRQTLAREITDYVNSEYKQLAEHAMTREGSGFSRFRKFSLELIDNTDLMVWWMNPGAAALCEGTLDESSDEPDDYVLTLVQAGHRDGSIDPLLSSAWIENLLWATLYAVHAVPTQGLSGFEVRNQAAHALLKAVAADQSLITSE